MAPSRAASSSRDGSRLARAGWRGVAGAVLAVAGAIALTPPGAGQVVLRVDDPAADRGPTAAYLDALDPARIAARGQDLASPRYDPKRLGLPIEALGPKVYDEARLAAVEARLAGVDRRAALRALFAAVTAGARSNRERHQAVLTFLQRASVHDGFLQPVYPDGTLVCDPLVLLELNEMRCGHVARVAVDLFEANGFDARLVQFPGHVAAEVSYDGAWHLIEADLFGGGWAPRTPRGTIPSVAELSADPAQLDRRGPAREAAISASDPRGSVVYPSFFCFSSLAGPTLPQYLIKTATRAEAAGSRLYGWNWYRWEPAPAVRVTATPARWRPGAVWIRAVTPVAPGRYRVAWNASADGDGDLLGYRVALSSAPRGWNYPSFLGDSTASGYGTGSWRPEQYDALFRAPPHDLGVIETAETAAVVEVPGAPVFVTVTPYDAYGDSIGREVYPASAELRLP